MINITHRFKYWKRKLKKKRYTKEKIIIPESNNSGENDESDDE